jgi:hypothetical protein
MTGIVGHRDTAVNIAKCSTNMTGIVGHRDTAVNIAKCSTNMSIMSQLNIQRDSTIYSLFIGADCSTCFG